MTFNVTDVDEMKRLVEVEKCVKYFLDDTRDDVFGSAEPIDQLYAICLKRSILVGKLSQIKDGLPEWWDIEQSWKDLNEVKP